MTAYIVRFGGVVPVLIALAVGVLIGRVIEAAAVGLVLGAIWSYVGRLVVGLPREPDQSGDAHLG